MEGSLSGFMTASGIVAGVLFIFAQVWGAVARDYERRKQATTTASVGLISAYLGALASLCALTIVVVVLLRGSNSVPISAIGLFLAALAIAIVQVAQPLFSLAVRLWSKGLFGPTRFWVNMLDIDWLRRLGIVFAVAAGIAIIVITIMTIASL